MHYCQSVDCLCCICAVLWQCLLSCVSAAVSWCWQHLWRATSGWFVNYIQQSNSGENQKRCITV